MRDLTTTVTNETTSTSIQRMRRIPKNIVGTLLFTNCYLAQEWRSQVRRLVFIFANREQFATR